MTPLFLLALTGLQTTPTTAPDQTAGKVAFPHPLISEVLYAVPSGKNGDANKDGVRSATGDEFIELVNPHDKPIELEGYRLSDGKPEGWSGKDRKPEANPDAKQEQGKGQQKPEGAKQDGAKHDKPSEPADDHEYQPLEFTFPKLTLQPGEVVVVFNGYESRIPGAVGDSAKAGEKNDKFNNAYVFSMKATSNFQALSNQHDMVVLTAPASAGGEAVECVRWDFRKPEQAPSKDKNQEKGSRGADRTGDQRPRDKHAESPAKLTENLPNARNSVQRSGPGGDFTDHVDLDGTLFSPGVFAPKKPPAPKEESPSGGK